MAIAADALVLQADVFRLHSRLVEIFRGAMVVDLVVGGLRRHDHDRNALEVDELARRRLLHPAHEEIRSVGLALALNRKLARILDRRIIGDRDVGRPEGALLDRIGPAIVLTHSQSGAFGWLIADARPQRVKAIIAIEPAGPPFEATIIGTGKARAWGPTDIPITYDPPVKDPADLSIEREAKADGPDLFVCWMQKAPARQLVNLKSIPVVIMAAEASYHQSYDHCTAKYLDQAGVKTEYIRLQDKRIRGNGHMVMIEKNNLDIARLLDDWMLANVR